MRKMDNRPIGIFDSGIGGLTVLEELRNTLPNETFIYLGDTLNFPYGEKTKDDIIKFSKNNIDFLIKQNCKLIIIACGTATSQALAEMKRLYKVPIIGIIKPTVEYIRKMNINKVGVIATKGTIRSGQWEKELKSVIPKIEVVNNACPLLANIAEEGKIYTDESKNAIHNYMEIFKQKQVENLILGCTHYPLFDKIITEAFNGNINLIYTGKVISNYLNDYLHIHNLNNNEESNGIKIITTKNEPGFDKKVKKILKSAKKLDITKFY